MKPNEILGMLPAWAKSTPEEIVAMPSWAMPCRFGETACVMRMDAILPSDTLNISIMLADEQYTLSLADTPRFENLHRLWGVRTEMPGPVLLALVEKECGPLLQLLENAVRRQLKIVALADDAPSGARLCVRLCADGEDILSFAITSSQSLFETLGKLAFVDTGDSSVREREVAADVELASFSLSAADAASISIGDALLLPEVGTVQPRLIVEGCLVADTNGVSRFSDDGRFRVLGAEKHVVTLGWLFDHTTTPSAIASGEQSNLRLTVSGRDVASGRLGKVAAQPAFIVEAVK